MDLSEGSARAGYAGCNGIRALSYGRSGSTLPEPYKLWKSGQTKLAFMVVWGGHQACASAAHIASNREWQNKIVANPRSCARSCVSSAPGTGPVFSGICGSGKSDISQRQGCGAARTQSIHICAQPDQTPARRTATGASIHAAQLMRAQPVSSVLLVSKTTCWGWSGASRRRRSSIYLGTFPKFMGGLTPAIV